MEKEKQSNVSLRDLFEQVKAIMAENDMGDHTVFVETRLVQYHHTVNIRSEVEIRVRIFISTIIDSSNIRQFNSGNPEHILSQIRQFFTEWNCQKQNTNPVEDVQVEF